MPPETAMVIVRNSVRRGTYLDSVVLMRMSRTVAAMAGVIECGLMMATPANKRIMADAGVLADDGQAAGPGDLVLALSAKDEAAAAAAMAAAFGLLDKPKVAGATANWTPRTIRAAAQADLSASVVLISVPGAFAAAEARKALSRGLNVMMFSDNVSLADEVALKQLARDKGLLMMGPDCGTAIINGVPLAFANVVPRGDIGIIGASGTGIQEVSCLIANAGRGISHAIGTGGRDLKGDVGGITTLMAIDLLDADPATRHIIVISKPPADAVAAHVLARVAQSKKPFTVCFIGGTDHPMPANATAARTLRTAADRALGRPPVPAGNQPLPRSQPGKLIRGLFAGGTLCAEAQVVLLDAGAKVASNAPVRGSLSPEVAGAHVLLDLGDDAYTQGRPHPMIEPAVRSAAFAAALRDDHVGVVLIDVVLGYGGHMAPVDEIARVTAQAGAHGKTLIAAVCGTERDPQNRHLQTAALQQAGFLVVAAMADAAAHAAAAVGLTS
jgi:FdrA protein